MARDTINMQPFCDPPVPGSFDYAVDVSHSLLLTEEEEVADNNDDHDHELARFNWTALIQRTFSTHISCSSPFRPKTLKNRAKKSD